MTDLHIISKKNILIKNVIYGCVMMEEKMFSELLLSFKEMDLIIHGDMSASREIEYIDQASPISEGNIDSEYVEQK